MQKLPKIGLPVVLLVVVVLIFVSKSSINIGYGEAGVLFKTFGGGVVTDEPALGEGFHIIAPWNKVYIYNVKQHVSLSLSLSLSHLPPSLSLLWYYYCAFTLTRFSFSNCSSIFANCVFSKSAKYGCSNASVA